MVHDKPQTMGILPGTPNNQFKMDVWWFPTISYIKIWNNPIETTIYKQMFQVPGTTTTTRTTTQGTNLHVVRIYSIGVFLHLLNTFSIEHYTICFYVFFSNII